LYTPDDGIYGAPVRTILGASDGAVYVGSAHGISRFQEGIWTRVFPVGGNIPWPIYTLKEGNDGSLWAATGWGALHFTQTEITLYTSKDLVAAVGVIAPDLKITTVPVPNRPWAEGLGIAVIQGSEGRDFGVLPWAICGLASGGPGESAGLKLGDQIVRINGEVLPGEMDGAAGTSVRIF